MASSRLASSSKPSQRNFLILRAMAVAPGCRASEMDSHTLDAKSRILAFIDSSSSAHALHARRRTIAHSSNWWGYKRSEDNMDIAQRAALMSRPDALTL